MPKKRKIFLKFIFTILLLILISIGVYWYFNFYKQPHALNKPAPSSIPSEQTQTERQINWQNLIPEIRPVLKQEFSSTDIAIEERNPIEIVKTADITGDGIPEALVDLGTGGAYTDLLTLMRIENGKPVVAILKDKNGELDSAPTFLQGASVRNGESVDMTAENKTIYSGSYSTDDSGALADCSVDAYQWNSTTKTFDWNETLSQELKQSYCSSVEKSLQQ